MANERIQSLRGILRSPASRSSPSSPDADNPEWTTTDRLDPDVLDAYRQEGKGWQTLINEVLRQNMPKHHKL